MNLIRIDNFVINLDNVVAILPCAQETNIYFTGSVDNYVCVPYPFNQVLDMLAIAGFTSIKVQP